MYASLRQRFEDIFVNCTEILDIEYGVMAPSAGIGRKKGKTSIANNGSTASSPSLRSKTPVLVDDSRPSSSHGPGGNVKVVVRVRGFLPRGEKIQQSKRRTH